MKTHYILIILVLTFCFGATAQMANSQGGDDPWDNLQNTFNDFFTDNSDKLEKLSRWYWLRQNDIRMWMDADYENESESFFFYSIDKYGDENNDATGVSMASTAHKGSIYGEFDWDNKALMLKGTTTAYETTYKAAINGKSLGEKTKKNPEEIIVQYTDKDGYWYVPYDDPNYQGTGEQMYIKFNAKQMAINYMQDYLELSKNIDYFKVYLFLYNILENFNWEALGFDFEDDWAEWNSEQMIRDIMESNGEINKRIEELIKELLDKENAEKAGFPIFIHWALMYNPDFIKEIETVSETKVTFGGNPNCTQLTVTSAGDNKGKSMIFDEYDRLVFINSLKEGTVRFAYDKDVTVKLPAAVDMSDLITGFSKMEGQKRAEQETEENYKEIIEELHREDKKKEEILEYIEKEIRELEVKKEQAITKKDRDEYQEIIDELKDILKKESN